jgi:hypothetical protein
VNPDYRTAATAAMDQHLAAAHDAAHRRDRAGQARELVSALDAAMATLPPCCPCTEQDPSYPVGTPPLDPDCECECHEPLTPGWWRR